MTPRVWGLLAGAALILLGILLPRGWYDELPFHPDLAVPPIRGVTLFQLCLVVDGLVALAFALSGRPYHRLPLAERLAVPSPPEGAETRRELWPFALLGLITALAAALRVHHLGSDLWLDEITTILDYEHMSAFEVLTTYINSNNHLLNTLLIKASMSLFGRDEWAIRLPAMLFGTATVPLMYWLSRFVLRRWSSLAVALLLALSYHHIFFSQNARGYIGYVFFSLLATGLLVRALETDRLGTWILFSIATLLNFAAHLNSAFVVASHALLGMIALVEIRRRGCPTRPMFGRLFVVFAVTGLLGLNLYATILPQVYVYVDKVYTTQSSGYAAFSMEHLAELLRGISAGFGAGAIIGAVPFLAMVGLGFVSLLRRNWVFTLALLLPNVVMGLFLVVRGLSFSPRFFLLALPFAVLLAVTAVDELGQRLAIRGERARRLASIGATALVAALALLSAFSLRSYYAAPKQDFRRTIARMQELREPGDRLVVIYLAEWGFRYYAKDFGLRESEDYFYVRSLERFDEVVLEAMPGRSLLVTTLHRALEIRYPELLARMRSGWEIAERFPGTIGGGTLAIWTPRAIAPR